MVTEVLEKAKEKGEHEKLALVLSYGYEETRKLDNDFGLGSPDDEPLVRDSLLDDERHDSAPPPGDPELRPERNLRMRRGQQ